MPPRAAARWLRADQNRAKVGAHLGQDATRVPVFSAHQRRAIRHPRRVEVGRKKERREGALEVFGPMHKGNAGEDQWAEMAEQRGKPCRVSRCGILSLSPEPHRTLRLTSAVNSPRQPPCSSSRVRLCRPKAYSKPGQSTMQGLGSARNSLLRHPHRPGPLVSGVLKGRGSLIEVVRCVENGLILFEQIEHTPDHKANITQGGLALRCSLQLQHRLTHRPKQHLQGRREGEWDGSIGHGGHRWAGALAPSRVRIAASCLPSPC
jgi:hypothetical protein